MKPVLIAVWLIAPCNSPVVEDPTARTTTVIACPNTFRESAGPHLAEGWTPPKAEKALAVSKQPIKKKKKRKKKRRARN